MIDMKTCKKLLLAAILSVSVLSDKAQDLRAFQIFDSEGTPATYQQMIETLAARRVVFFGEQHNCPIAHWLELKVAQSLYHIHQSGFAMGAEMFETDNRLILDEWIAGVITEKNFETEMRLWNNYKTDYAPLIRFAQKHAIPFAATNIPRRYAQVVSRKGLAELNNLSPQAGQYIAPLPIPYEKDDAQVAIFRKMTENMGHGTANPEFMAQAQALKDATMAWSITQSIGRETRCFLHFNGSFHSERHQGIIPFLHAYAQEKLSVGVISVCRQNNIDRLDDNNRNKGDFIICVPNDMATSY